MKTTLICLAFAVVCGVVFAQGPFELPAQVQEEISQLAEPEPEGEISSPENLPELPLQEMGGTATVVQEEAVLPVAEEEILPPEDEGMPPPAEEVSVPDTPETTEAMDIENDDTPAEEETLAAEETPPEDVQAAESTAEDQMAVPEETEPAAMPPVDMATGYEQAEPGPTDMQPFVITAEDPMPEFGMNGGDEPATDEQTAKEPDLITVTLDDVPLQDVVRMFTRISGANIIATSSNLQGTVTANLENVPWKPALTAILNTHSLALKELRDEDSGSLVYRIIPRPKDAPDPQFVFSIFLKYARAVDVANLIKSLWGARAFRYQDQNALLIKTTSALWADIKKAIEAVDIPHKQVFIEAKFVELNDQAIKNLGVNWQSLQAVQLSAGNMGFQFSDVESMSMTEDNTMALRDRRESTDNVKRGYDPLGTEILLLDNDGDVIATRQITDSIEKSQDYQREADDSYERSIDQIRTAVLGVSDFKLVLSALKETDGVDIVSNPKIIVANGKKASIHIGEKEPNIRGETTTPESGAPVTTYNLDSKQPYFDFGVQLDVVPTVHTADKIHVTIQPTLRRFISSKVAPDGNAFPITSEKTIDTEFTLGSGNTAAIGGLTETQERESITKVPLLGDIPLIGKYLFSHTSLDKRQAETIIFVTVGIADPDHIVKETGIPEKARLIHQHMAREALAPKE